MTDTVRIPAERLRRHCASVLSAVGVPQADAELVADSLVTADLRGVDSHGVNLMSLYVERLQRGEMCARTEVDVVRDDGSTVLLDGGLGLGQVAGVRAVELAAERALAHGVAAVAVRESTHLGALGYYTLRAAERGVVAFAFQNGPAFVPAYGGLSPLFSTNPMSYAIPTDEERPIVYDVATTAVAGNKLILARKEGRPIPEGWATDAAGTPTTDPHAASIDQLQWFGGHKGFGIALLVEILAGVLTGSSFALQEYTASPLAGRERIAKGYTFLALDPDRFIGTAELRKRTDALIRDVHASEPAAGVERVLVPGEIEHRCHDERSAHGIPLSRALVAELEGLRERLGIQASELGSLAEAGGPR
jgi:LDH2 family malate/lactate/ureidoglycolate dehydrogenase